MTHGRPDIDLSVHTRKLLSHSFWRSNFFFVLLSARLHPAYSQGLLPQHLPNKSVSLNHVRLSTTQSDGLQGRPRVQEELNPSQLLLIIGQPQPLQKQRNINYHYKSKTNHILILTTHHFRVFSQGRD